MSMPFTVEQFFDVFSRYNHGVFPAQVFLVGLALLALVLVSRKAPGADRAVAVILACLWLWMGTIYHLVFFRVINPAAVLFGAGFILEGALFLWVGLFKDALHFRRVHTWRLLIAASLLLYALVVYPTWMRFAGHNPMASPTFGAPCPTTIFTFGVLFAARPPIPRYLLIIPLLWAAIGFFAALHLDVPQDYGLLIAGVLGLWLLRERPRSASSSPQKN